MRVDLGRKVVARGSRIVVRFSGGTILRLQGDG